ncbi:MAG TPA: hypothetical protein GXX75_18460 [Clostridiales bacterium]|nr:hypothetical protein [Clostridiales bacterium]
MNKKLGTFAAAVNLLAVIGFAIDMVIGTNFWNYFTSLFIAFSFVIMICTFAHYGGEASRAAGFSAIAFSAMYALCNLTVYFIQLTTVRNSALTNEAMALLDFRQFGLIFNLDMLGYCLMSISTFLIGFTIEVRTRSDRWLKWLLMLHGVFAIGCFIMPMLGLFGPDTQGNDLIGILILEFWCIYFAPIGILSILHFSKKA